MTSSPNKYPMFHMKHTESQPLKASDILIERIRQVYAPEQAQREGVIYWPPPLPTPEPPLNPDPLVLFRSDDDEYASNQEVLVPFTFQEWLQRREHHTGKRPIVQIPLGMIDRPEKQARQTLLLDLHRITHTATTNVISTPLLLVGGQNTGKAAALQTILLWLKSYYLPSQLRYAVLDPSRDLEAFNDGFNLWSEGANDEQVFQFIEYCTRIQVERRERYSHIHWNDETLTQLWQHGHDISLFVIVLSQFHRFVDRMVVFQSLKKLIMQAVENRASGIYLIITSTETSLRYLPLDILNKMNTRIVLFLQELQRAEFLGRTYPMEPIPGRGLLLTRGQGLHQVQLALPISGSTEAIRYERLFQYSNLVRDL